LAHGKRFAGPPDLARGDLPRGVFDLDGKV
jgi:hypothetical protein